MKFSKFEFLFQLFLVEWKIGIFQAFNSDLLSLHLVIYMRDGHENTWLVLKQKEFSTVEFWITSQWFLDILEDFSLFRWNAAQRVDVFGTFFPNAAQRPIWVGHPALFP